MWYEPKLGFSLDTKNMMLWHSLNEAWTTLTVANTDKTEHTFRLMNI